MSIDDQVHDCQKTAERNNWLILPDYIRSDEGKTGATLYERDGLLSLLEDAKRSPCPFKRLLIWDTSRMGRNLGEVLTISDRFKYRDISLYFVTKRLDSRDPNYRTQLIVYGMQDEQQLVEIKTRTSRGLKSKIRKGYNAGAQNYGYRSVHIEDPTRKDSWGRLRIIGSRRERVPEQAEVLLRMAETRISGATFTDIAAGLNADGIPTLRGGKWNSSTVLGILRNKIYRGIIEYGKTTTLRNPDTGKLRTIPVPEAEWEIKVQPELQIFSDELWEKLRATDRQMDQLGKHRLGGTLRTPKSKTNLFSTLLKCGVCGGPISIVRNNRQGDFYGCVAHRDGRLCPNAQEIERGSLEAQLLGALIQKLTPDVLAEAINCSQAEEYLKSIGTAVAKDDSALQARLAELKKQQATVTRAIARSEGKFQGLLSELETIDGEIKAVQQQLAQASGGPKNPGTVDEFKAFVTHKAGELQEVLTGDRVMAKHALRQLISRLILTPLHTPDGPALEVTGDVNLFAIDGPVMLSGGGTRYAKHYAFPLSLTGLRLDPRRATRAGESSKSVGDAEILAAFTNTPALNAANV